MTMVLAVNIAPVQKRYHSSTASFATMSDKQTASEVSYNRLVTRCSASSWAPRHCDFSIGIIVFYLLSSGNVPFLLSVDVHSFLPIVKNTSLMLSDY